ncbi:MAG: DUF4838 domain-containing protein [bacterium]
MKKSMTVIFVLLLVLCFVASETSCQTITIAQGGKSDYKIVVPDGAGEAVAYAAEEMARFLEKIGGARLGVVAESQHGGGLGIFISIETSGGLCEECFRIKTAGNDLRIEGGGPRGALYGVYAFLEEQLGCRWYAPGASVIPKKEKIEIGPLDVEQKPAFEYREPFFYHAFDPDWAARNRANGTRPPLTKKHGGKIQYSHFVHTFYSLVPPDEYFDEHPEYFALINGERQREKSQLCLTNPDVLKIATEKVLRWIEEDPDAKIFSVSQNDNIMPCQCDKCRALNEKEGSPAGPLLHFVNAVAREVGKKYPDKYISTLAYQYTEKTPRYVRPEPNVIIRLCHMAPSCDLHPLGKCFWNDAYVKNLKAWDKISDKIYVWHYVTDFWHYTMPFPDLVAIGSDMAFYHKHGVQGLFAQGSYQSHGGDMAELKAWLIAKLLWNPYQNPQALIKDFVDGYFGPAAEPMMDYIKALHKKVFKKTIHANLYSPPTEGFLNKELLEYSDECFDRAEKLAAADPAVLERVRLARMPLTYVKLKAPHLYGWTAGEMRPGGAQGQPARFEKFKRDLAHFRITLFREGETLEESLTKILDAIENNTRD